MTRFFLSILSMEVRKELSYRADFWGTFFFQAFARLTVSYFLWFSIFEFMKVKELGGRSLEQMMVYFLVMFFVDDIVRGALTNNGMVSREIYDGSLSRFLLYPVSYLTYKLAQILGQMIVSLVRMAVGLGFFALIWGWPEAPALTLSAFGWGLVSLIPAILLFFSMTFVLEILAFWAENIWSLLVMLRFISGFLGGAFMPIALYPEWAQALVHKLPFYFTLGLPTELFLGAVSPTELIRSFLVSGSWLIVVSGLGWFVWNRGVRNYSGVGM